MRATLPSGGSYGNARGKMLELVRRARRRLLNSELISQGSNTFAVALAAFIVLLILGTQILEWYWLAPIPLAAAVAGVYLALRRVPSPYRAAQMVDDRAQLADTVSTALYFSDKTDTVSPDLLEWQRNRAEDAARQVDLPRVLPYSAPRSMYVVAALALVASSLFALRYGLTRSLDLKPGLARMIREEFTPADKKEVAENRREKPAGKDDTDTSNDAANQDQSQQGQDQPDADNPSDQGDSQNGEKNGDSKDQAKPNGDQSQEGQQGQDQQAGDKDQQQQQDGAEQGAANQRENNGDSKQQTDGKQNSNNAGESGSLLSKMKDFAENLLSKIKPQQQDKTNQSQQASNQNSKQGQNQQGQQQKGQPQNSKDGQQGQSDQADAQQAQNGEQRDGQESKGKGSGDKSQNNKQPGSGIGSEDGDKSIKRAEQLAAMGKITELIGKRSATVTGESTVEVQNTNQQLHTAYVERGAQHTQAGAQIDRDEVPVALQSYVEQYFDQVRKQAPAAAPKKQQ